MPDPHLGHVAHSISEPCIPQCPLYAEGGEARNHEAESEVVIPTRAVDAALNTFETYRRKGGEFGAMQRSLRAALPFLSPALDAVRHSPQGEGHGPLFDPLGDDAADDLFGPQDEGHEFVPQSESASWLPDDDPPQGDDHEVAIEAATKAIEPYEDLSSDRDWTVRTIVAAYLSRCPSPERCAACDRETREPVIDSETGDSFCGRCAVEMAVATAQQSPERDTEKLVGRVASWLRRRADKSNSAGYAALMNAAEDFVAEFSDASKDTPWCDVCGDRGVPGPGPLDPCPACGRYWES